MLALTHYGRPEMFICDGLIDLDHFVEGLFPGVIEQYMLLPSTSKFFAKIGVCNQSHKCRCCGVVVVSWYDKPRFLVDCHLGEAGRIERVSLRRLA